MLFATVMVTTGFQAAWFAVYTKTFAVAEGLMLSDPMIERIAKVMTLENGLIAGGLLFLAGLGTALFSIFRWWQAGWGDLEPQQTMRLVIMSCLMLAMGAQICFSSFFLSILGLKKQIGR
jgi:hypothetical protein